MGVRNFHSKHGNSHPLARNCLLEGYGNFAGKGPESFVGVRIQIEDIVVFRMLGNDEGMAEGNRADVEEGVVVFVLCDFPGWDFTLGNFGEDGCH